MPLISIDKSLRARLLAIEPEGQEMEQWCWAACSQMVVSYLRSNLGGKGRTADNKDLRQGEQANRVRQRRAEAAARVGHSAADGPAAEDVDCGNPRTAAAYKACNQTGFPSFFELDAVAQSTEWSSFRFLVEEHGIPLRENGWPRTIAGGLSSARLRDLVLNSGPDFYRRLFDAEDCALSWPMLQSLIDNDLPVIFGWRYPERGGHFMVAAGYVVTPPDEKWVVVIDPLPPHHGDWYMVPYDYWVAGPYGRHWRDWWVPCSAPGQPLAPAYSIDRLRVGRELVRSNLSVSKNLPRPVKRANGHWLTEKERAATWLLAKEGLDALKEIASQAPELTAALGMGGSMLRLILKGFILEFLESDGKPELAAKVEKELKAARVDPAKLVLDPEYIPVFGLNRRNLVDWDGRDPGELLTAPRQVIYRVERGDFTTYPFFSTITLQRYDDSWRLASIGRSSLTSSLATGQLFAVLEAAGKQDELSFAGLVQGLDELDLLETVAKLISTAEIDKLEQSLEGSSEAGTGLEMKLRELAAELRELLKEKDLDTRALKRLARRADKAGKEAKIGKVEEEKPDDVEKPVFAVDVGELYQLFVAYTDDELVPVYPSSFYPPDRRVSAGDKASVLRQLKSLAEKI